MISRSHWSQSISRVDLLWIQLIWSTRGTATNTYTYDSNFLLIESMYDCLGEQDNDGDGVGDYIWYQSFNSMEELNSEVFDENADGTLDGGWYYNFYYSCN